MKAIKYSRQREALAELLHSTHSHPDAAWLYQQMKEKFPNISLATVYRNLNQLTESGEVIRISTSDADHFDGNTTAHSHLVCKGCGAIVDLDIGMDTLFSGVEQDYGIKIDNHCLLFEGLCPECNED